MCDVERLDCDACRFVRAVMIPRVHLSETVGVVGVRTDDLARIDQLAEAYGVERPTMLFRLQELGMLEAIR